MPWGWPGAIQPAWTLVSSLEQLESLPPPFYYKTQQELLLLLLLLWWWWCTQELRLVLLLWRWLWVFFREVPHGSCIAARSWCGTVGVFGAWRSGLQYFGASLAKRAPSLVGCSGFAWLGSHQALAGSCSSAPNFCSRDCWTHSSSGIVFCHQSHYCRQRRRPFH